MKVLIVYYSTFGNVYRMAQLVAAGVQEVAGAEPVLRRVPELIPASVIDSKADRTAGRDLQKDVPLVTTKNFKEAAAIAFGTPTRFGNVSAQLKNQIDQLSPLWLAGQLEGKPAGVFVSTGSLHGGQETTIHTLMAPLLHLGMILVGVPYSLKALFTTQGAARRTVRAIWPAATISGPSTNRKRRSAARWESGLPKSASSCRSDRAELPRLVVAARLNGDDFDLVMHAVDAVDRKDRFLGHLLMEVRPEHARQNDLVLAQLDADLATREIRVAGQRVVDFGVKLQANV